MDVTLEAGGRLHEVNTESLPDGSLRAGIDGSPLALRLRWIDANSVLLQFGENQYRAYAALDGDTAFINIGGHSFTFRRAESASAARSGESAGSGDGDGRIGAPMPGKLLKIFVKAGQSVEPGERLFIVEAMKMENDVKSPAAGVVKKVYFAENDLVSVGDVVVELKDPAEK